MYAAAFRNYGVDVMQLTAGESARRIQDLPSSASVVTALDYWAHIKDRLRDGDGAPLRAVAHLVDNDSWRQQLRDSRARQDREALESLGDKDGALNQPVANLLILSHLLDNAKAKAASVRLLRRAQEHRPAAFWINFELGSRHSKDATTAADAVGYLRAAL